MARNQYLQRRRQGWYAVVEIPKPLRVLAGGRPRFIKSLETQSVDEANKRKHVVVAAFKAQIAELALQGKDPHAAEWRFAGELRDSLVRSLPMVAEAPRPGVPSRAIEDVESVIADTAAHLERTAGTDVAERFHALATGRGTLVESVLDPWLTELTHRQAAAGQTIVQHRATVRLFIEWAGAAVTVESVDKRKAGGYVSHLMASDRAKKTIMRHLSSLAALWDWLDQQHELPTNVWRGHGRRVGKGSKNETLKRAYTDDELVALLTCTGGRKNSYTSMLHDLIRLDLMNGARAEEWCALKRKDCVRHKDGWWITVREGKTEAAARSFPLHPAVAPILERLLATGSDEFVFPGLTPGGPDDKRSWNVTKAFGRFAHHAGVDDPATDFHSFRRTFLETCEGCGTPESTAKLIVGHKRGESLTYGTYSKGQRVDLRAAMNRLHYSDAVMPLIVDRATAKV